MTPNSRLRPRLERLECRDVPSVVIVNPTMATYTDVDGDHVTIKVSKGTLTAGLFTTVAVTAGHDQLQEINVSGGGFDGANITFSVAKVAGGDGLANVGYINSTGHDLGTVIVKGDLGQIDAGTDSATVPAIKSLAVNSMGRLGTDTQLAGGDLESDINGALGALTVKQEVVGAYVNVAGTKGKIGPITIGGSLIGGSNKFSGAIFSSGVMGAVKIGHDVQGGSASGSGFIQSTGRLASVSIGGSLLGGGGSLGLRGVILANGDSGEVKIGHDVQGGSSFNSGMINVGGKLAGVSIGGSLIGGADSGTGEIICGGDIGVVEIGHDFIGGSIAGTASLDSSGVIESSGGRIASVTIGGSIISGVDSSSGTLGDDATIRAANDIGSLIVKGSLIGHGDTGTGASPVVISARGQAVQGKTTDLTIGKIRIGGRVEFANILAGYDRNLTALNGDAQIGAVMVGGDWVASNLVAGAKNAASGNTNFGNFNDASIGAGNPNIIATIASVTIGGQVFGTPASVSATDHFGFVAQQIDAVKIGGSAIALKAGPNNDNLNVGETNDLTVHEV